MNHSELNHAEFYRQLTEKIKAWGQELGFQQVGVSDGDVSAEQPRLEEWLAKGYHGNMQWMEDRKTLRLNPDQLLPHTQRIISVRMDYFPPNTEHIKVLKSPEKAYISRYALGRDYHKLVRKRLATLGKKIDAYVQQHTDDDVHFRPYVDSAPALERPLAEKAGLGWTGKHTLIINRHAGSWFFLGELFTNLPLTLDNTPQENLCGDCTACLKVCPTDAFPKPYQLDARRCISYLTIENKGAIPEEFREPMGNRVFGCDDCQAICPWNKYAKPTCETDFHPRHGLDSADLLTLFLWDEDTFLNNTAGSPIRRIGYEKWQRNLAVGLGNAPSTHETITALQARLKDSTPLVQEHILWAIEQQQRPKRKRQRKLKRDATVDIAVDTTTSSPQD